MHTYDILFEGCPATFQYVVDIILFSVKSQFALAYLGDTVIFSRTPLKHINLTRLVQSILKEAGVNLKLKSVHFSPKILIISVTLSVRVDLNSPTTTLTLHANSVYQQQKLNYVHSTVCLTFSSLFFQISLTSRPRCQGICASRTLKSLASYTKKSWPLCVFYKIAYISPNISLT